MKILPMLLLLFVLLNIRLAAQPASVVHHFSAVNKEVSWESTTLSLLDFSALVKAIQSRDLLMHMHVGAHSISGKLKPFAIAYRGAGFNNSNVPAYLLGNLVEGFFMLEFRDGRYRVLLKHIVFVEAVGEDLLADAKRMPLEGLSLQEGGRQFKSDFKTSASSVLNYTFTHFFNFNTKLKR